MKRRLGDRYRVAKRSFRVDYFWIENDQRRQAHSVGDGVDQADAEQKFQRRNRHLTVIRADAQEESK